MITELTPEYVTTMPPLENMENGIIYVSHRFSVCIHLCVCGCRGQVVTPINKDHNGWKFTDNDGKITLRPSIGNWNGEKPYHVHYYITEGKIKILK